MKIKDLKHNHSLTDLLKILIFSILMLAPMIAVAVKCAYVVVNKNANQSYSGIVQAQSSYPLTLENGNQYEFNKIENEVINLNATIKLTIDNFASSIGDLENYVATNRSNINKIIFTNIENGVTQFRMFHDDTFLDYWTLNVSTQVYMTFTCNENVTLSGNDWFKSYNITPSTLDNVFYYAIDEMSDNQLFSWTKNTGIYTGVKAMTDNLDITTDVIAVLITYWTLLTVIYVIIDIVLKGFTLLTHMFQKESH